MTFDEVMKALEGYGNAQSKKVLMRHGAKEPFFGVKVADLKQIVKKVKKNHELSLQLYATGNSDAMYLAGLIADESRISKEQLQNWVKNAYWYMLSDYTVPWVAAQSPYGFELALDWIRSDKEFIQSAGWSTLSSLAAVRNDATLDLTRFQELLEEVGSTIHTRLNRVRYSMNGFVIAVGSYIVPLSETAARVAENIGKVEVEMGGTSCKVPFAPEYIRKVSDKGNTGKKRKDARC